MDSTTPAYPLGAHAPLNGAPSYLLVMHDFSARSPDELSLRKGETVELIADDSEFGDGWYMGRRLATNEKGLFPQVYTTPIIVDDTAMINSPAFKGLTAVKASAPSPASVEVLEQTTKEKASQQLSPSIQMDSAVLDSEMPPLTVEKTPKSTTTTIVTNEKTSTIVGERKIAEDQVADSAGHGMVSPVVEDTLSDIEEAISEISARNNKILRSLNQRHSVVSPTPQLCQQDMQDSSSDYSRQEDLEGSDAEVEESPVSAQRLHDIQYTSDEVSRWSPADVARYLRSRSVTQSTCNKFEEQEVSGVILMQLQMSDLKELDLGSFGKRFEVWKEIEHLLDNLKVSTRLRSSSESKTTVSTISRDSSSTVRSSSLGRTILPRIKSQHNHSTPRPHHFDVEEANSFVQSSATQLSGTATTLIADTPTSAMFERPRSPPISPAKGLSQTSHRRNLSGSISSSEFSQPTSLVLHSAYATGAAIIGAGPNQRNSSFDRSWRSSAPKRPNTSSGPSSAHQSTMSSGTNDSIFTGDSTFSGSGAHPPKVTEKNYLSGDEMEGQEYQLLGKKSFHTSHNRKPSYAEEHRVRTGTAHSKHSTAGSMDTLRDEINSPLSLSIYNDEYNTQGKRSTSDVATDFGIQGALPPSTSHQFEADHTRISRDTVGSPRSIGSMDPLEKKHSTPSIAGTATSDPRPPTGKEAKTNILSETHSLHTTASGPDSRKKSGKKGTSAYLEGLRNITPLEAAKEGDFSGWMQKRGSGNMGTWKPRFFVLRGRRLSYFYSANDIRERGLIDVTSHKVLSATEDRLVNLQATIAAATSPSTSPASTATSPEFYQSLNSRSGDMSISEYPPTSRTSGIEKKEHSREKGWFTFKLVPPAPGAAKGVTFTPPRVHYFATDSREVGRAWMAAIMKATIELDPNGPVRMSYSAATISLAKARALKARPPDLPGNKAGSKLASTNERGNMGLAISGVDLDTGDADVEEDGEDYGNINGARTSEAASTNRTSSSIFFEGQNRSNVLLEETESRRLGAGVLRTPSLDRLLTGDSKG